VRERRASKKLKKESERQTHRERDRYQKIEV
jgi:hypothetical protein